MKLYGYWRSSSAWRVRIALALKDLPYQTIHVDLRDPAAPAELGGLCQVPVLALPDGRRLTQSSAIIRWLDAEWPTPPLWPESVWDRARVDELVQIVNAGIQPLQNLRVLRTAGRAFASSAIADGLGALEALASTGPFLLGDRLTVADLFLVPQLYNARRFEVPLAAFERLRAIEHHCLNLPAFRAAHPDQHRS